MLSGITPVWASEIEPFPIRVTTKRLPFMKHYGDVSKMDGADVEPVDIITFGSPCQDMSIAGRREGLDGSRSSLFYEAVRIVKEMRCATDGKHPRYIVWENVPGAFSSNKGADFQSVLEEICSVKGYEIHTARPERWPAAGEIVADDFSLAWRVFDAQYWGVPQRRKRIYLVADFAGGSAGKILFESEGVSGYTPQGFRPWQGTAGTFEEGAGASGCVCLNDQGGSRMDVTEDVAATLRAENHGHPPCVMGAAGFCTEHSAQARGIGYDGFSDLHIRARVGFPQNGGGRAGVFLGNLFCCLNYDTQRVELYQGSTLLGSYSTSFSKTPDAQLHSDPTVYTIEMRKRGSKVRVYSGSSYTLRFTATVSATSGYAGIQADNEIVCDLLRAGDAWAYEPYECFDVVYPDGVRTSFGRIARSGVTWDEEFQIFSVNSDVDEGSTRSEDISLDYDFFHSHLLEISCGNDYTARVIPRDINVWTARLFLGDADGFSILYYQDVDSLVYWANEAAYRWGLRGIAIWSLGQEDMRLWEVMPKQIE